MGTEGSEEEVGMEESRLWDRNGHVEKVEKGKGKEKADDRNCWGFTSSILIGSMGLELKPKNTCKIKSNL